MMISFFEIAFPLEEEKNLDEDGQMMDNERDLDIEQQQNQFMSAAAADDPTKAELQAKYRQSNGSSY